MITNLDSSVNTASASTPHTRRTIQDGPYIRLGHDLMELHARHLGATATITYCLLAKRTQRDGLTRMTVEEIAKAIGAPRRRAQRALRMLEARGRITAVRQ